MHNIPGETKEECVQRLRRDFDRHVEMYWDDCIGHLEGVFGITNKEANELMEAES